MKTLNELIQISTEINETRTFETNIKLFEDDKQYQPYEACVSYREISFYCENEVLCYDVNCTNGIDNFTVLRRIVN